MVYFILGFSIALNLIFIILGIFVIRFYFSQKTKNNSIEDLIEGVGKIMKDDSIVDENMAKDFFYK